jgi:opacity protein-like surface antigen
MKLNGINYPATVFGIFLALSGAEIQAGTMGPVQVAATEKVYLSIFGGGGTSNQVNISQYGTAFYFEGAGGPLAVNAFGRTNSRSVGIVGGNLGYQFADIGLNSLNIQGGLSPAAELEGYYVGKSSFRAHDINNETTRLPEHDFLVTYPLSTGVFLVNAVLNFNSPTYTRWRPFVGAGIGAAVLSVSNADALQTSPPEADVNHYNSNPNDTAAAFAAQTKVGLNFAFSEHLSVFAEYRWLYIANTNFTFGSTVSPGHAATSSWNAHLGSQHYNMGAAGLRFTV